MILSVHQPNYLPDSGFFKKIALCDTFIFLDDVQYEKNGYTNRNKIRVNNEQGWEWLTVPVHAHHDTLVRDVKIDYSSNWVKQHLGKIDEYYNSAKNFQKVFPLIETHYECRFIDLMTLNVNLIMEFCRLLNLNPKMSFSSNFDIETKGSDRILDLCRLFNCDVYLSGGGGRKYLKMEDFANNDIDMVFIGEEHKPYRQVFEPFISGLSELDFIMNGAII